MCQLEHEQSGRPSYIWLFVMAKEARTTSVIRHRHQTLRHCHATTTCWSRRDSRFRHANYTNLQRGHDMESGDDTADVHALLTPCIVVSQLDHHQM